MYKILLCCKSGITTSMLVNNMKKEARNQDINALIWAIAENSIELSWGNADCILVAPQNAGDLDKIKDLVDGAIPVDVIDRDCFVTMDGKAVLDQAMHLLNS
ncbi:PTS sugar transporter subunit IIB [uncultured Thomasclavelia sp.]|uniref:PTS sugar transporter subunit IIB n=1 Tax=uncultured Thomasclavelia sp. TaxID=3025759 RepID=UPI0025E1626C|nr:PTS sugar transporter subunit IIB [uncultured Thomasclavelia sp.]